MQIVEPLLLTVAEVARRSKFGEKAVRNAIKRGELRAYKLCGQWRIRDDDYEEWVEGSKYVPASAAVAETVPVPPMRGSLAALRRIESEAA